MEGTLKIVMLEDNPDDANFIQKTLARGNLLFEAKVVFTPDDFINALNSYSPDVVLSDHQLPQFNSMEALVICKEISPFTPFILVTGAASEEFAASIIKAGADDYLLKNNLKRLVTAVQQSVDKKKTQKLLHVTQQQIEFDRNNLTALINNTNDLMWSVDRDLKLITSNHAFDEMVKRLSGQDVIKGADSRIPGFSEDQLKRFAGYYKRAFAGEAFTEIEHNTNPEQWSEISYYPILKDGDVIGTACFSRDITNRKKEENHLKLLESVITHATDSVLITEGFPLDDPGPRIIYVNDAFLRMTGYSREEVIGNTPRMLQGPKSNREELDRMRVCMENLRPCEIEIVNYKKNGDTFWINMAIAPVINNEEVASHFIAIEKDVTERINNLQSIQEQNTKLKDIAWMQSHDVRGPLARIMGLTNLLQNHSSKDNDEVMSYLIASANDLDAVIKKIVDKTEQVG